MFDGFYISHVSRLQNTKADALAALAATLTLPADTTYCLNLEVSEVHTTSTNFEPREW